MLPNSKIVKQTAKTALKGKYLSSCLACGTLTVSLIFGIFLNYAVSQIFGSAMGVITLLLTVLFLCLPLYLGVCYFFRRLMWGENDGFVTVFHYFESKKLYLSALSLSANLFVRALLAGFVFFIPAIVTILLSNNAFYTTFHSTMPSWAPNLWVATRILSALACIALFCVLLKYFLSPFIFVSVDNITPAQCIEKSVVATKDKLHEIFWFSMSFIGWVILGVFVFPIFLTSPYIICSNCIYSRFIIANFNKKIDELKKTAPKFEA